jgi:hypothetical protein
MVNLDTNIEVCSGVKMRMAEVVLEIGDIVLFGQSKLIVKGPLTVIGANNFQILDWK